MLFRGSVRWQYKRSIMKTHISPKLQLMVVLYLFLNGTLGQAQGSFTEAASTYGIATAGSKEGGLSWADFDADGDLDLLVNTNSNSLKSILYRNDGGTFTNVTASLAPRLSVNRRQRVAIWGDMNNDGKIDFMRNQGGSGSQKMEIYLQDSLTGIFGDGRGGTIPIYVGSSSSDDVQLTGGLNTEALGYFDLDGDGDLDIYIDNHNHGIDLLRNNFIDHLTGTIVDPAPAALFSHITPGNSSILGLPQSATDGDYGAAADIDDDGWVDIFIRKRDESDIYMNQGGSFANPVEIGQATNGNKGAVALYDLDNDGDYDGVWTDNDGNYLWRFDGAGTWTRMDGSLGIESRTDIDGVAGGDVDNDGDIDLIFTGGSKSYLYLNDLNNSSGPGRGTAFRMELSSEFDAYSANSGNGEGVVMVDFDGDGDIDIYENKHNGNNRLWVNNLYTSSTAATDKNYVQVDVFESRDSVMQSGHVSRYAIGASVFLKDCRGNILSLYQGINGGKGHGTQDPLRLHFGLPYGNNYTYVVEVRYPNILDPAGGAPLRPMMARVINPARDGLNLLQFFSSEFKPGKTVTEGLCPPCRPVYLNRHIGWSSGN